ncbi:MAG TPA: hypothetical protein VFH27_18315, partial [Longimicrobiaceae bacterium]|nr:hypothetical protein [Longimicrobiaceae bacterium]
EKAELRTPNAAVARRTPGTMNRTEADAQCPRCGYTGPGYGHFSRGANVGKLVAATVVTAGVMGAGGIAYYLLRKDHRLCPHCGLKWGQFSERALAPTAGSAGMAMRPPVPAVSVWAEARRRRGSIVLFVLALLLLTVGLTQLEAVPFVLGSLAAAGGFFLHKAAVTAREERREALIAALQPHVLKLAGERNGRLTVTDVATSLGWALPRAEKVLNSLDDGMRVRSDVTDEGVIVYEFPEVMFSTPRFKGPLSGGSLGGPAMA